MPIETLITGQDGAEQVRDRIAQILVDESRAQQQLALAARENPQPWALRVATERAEPWGSFQDAPNCADPIINVWFDTDSFDKRTGNVVDGQRAVGTFNVDCYGYAKAKPTGINAHKTGDELAALEADRAAALCRKILMSASYLYLGFPRGELVESRWLRSRTKYQIPFDEDSAQRVVGVRLAFEVQYQETAPQHQGQPLEYISAEITRNSDGFLLAQVDHDYTA